MQKKVVGENRKPGSVPRRSYLLQGDDHSSRAAVADGFKQPDPGVSDGPSSSTPLFGLAPDGVYRAADVTDGTGELLPHPFTLTRFAEAQTGGLLSVALSLGSPPVPVKDHPALWSPDFPPAQVHGPAIAWLSPTTSDYQHYEPVVKWRIQRIISQVLSQKAGGCNVDKPESHLKQRGC